MSGAQVVVRSIMSGLSNLVGNQNIWGTQRKNRLLSPSPRNSDTDLLEMDSDIDTLFVLNYAHRIPKNIVRDGDTIRGEDWD